MIAAPDRARAGGAVAHYFTVDVEEHFHAAALEAAIPRFHWHRQESRVMAATASILEILEAAGARGTFFVLGWVAARRPDVVRAIADAGHEVASHGWDHRTVSRLDPGEFRESVRNSKALLEAITGRPVIGYRAPNFSIVRGCEAAFEILLDEGYLYDSSLFPIRRPGYGWAGGGRDPHRIACGDRWLQELPPATVRLGSVNIPAGGGAWFRLFPYQLTRSALRDSAARGMRATFYMHPWEMDPGQPRARVHLPTRLRHYGGLAGMRRRVERLLAEFRFTAIRDGLDAP